MSVHQIKVNTVLDTPPDDVLKWPIEKLNAVIVIGEQKDGQFYLAASFSHYGDLLLMLEDAKRYVMDQYRSQNETNYPSVG